MTFQEIISGLFAFLLGLIAKFIYDLWVDRRQRQALTFTKKTLSSFSSDILGEGLRDRTQLLFSNVPVRSIQIVVVEVENTGSRAVKNQAFTVRFDDKARILGKPRELTSSEDFRFVQEEKIENEDNVYRFKIHLLQKRRRLSWEFVVIDNLSGKFVVEHGVAAEGDNLTDVDLDVSSVITTSRAQLDLIGQVRRSVSILIGIAIIGSIRDIAISFLGNFTSALLNPIIILLLLILFYNTQKAIAPLLELLRSLGESRESGSLMTVHGGIVTLSNLIGRDHIRQTQYYREFSPESTLFEKIYERARELPENPDIDKNELLDTLKKIEEEVKKGEDAYPNKVERWLLDLGILSDDIFQATTAILTNQALNFGTGIRLIAQRARKEQATRLSSLTSDNPTSNS
jgi:hypothetical protein